jgi:hypothetical protein
MSALASKVCIHIWDPLYYLIFFNKFGHYWSTWHRSCLSNMSVSSSISVPAIHMQSLQLFIRMSHLRSWFGWRVALRSAERQILTLPKGIVTYITLHQRNRHDTGHKRHARRTRVWIFLKRALSSAQYEILLAPFLSSSPANLNKLCKNSIINITGKTKLCTV